MATPTNWTQPQDLDSWMRHQEKRIMRSERRPQVNKASDLLGPGFGPLATHLIDWNAEEARFNGFFHSGGDAANVPVPGYDAWHGLVISTGDHTIQILWSHGGDEQLVFQRQVHVHANHMPDFHGWEPLASGGGGGSNTLAGLLDVALSSPTAGEFLKYSGSTWVNAAINRADIADFAHTHDDRYYTEAEVDTALSGKANTVHEHDDRYYTEVEVDAALGGKADTVHTHDDRYYTEAEVDNIIDVHTHTLDDITGGILNAPLYMSNQTEPPDPDSGDGVLWTYNGRPFFKTAGGDNYELITPDPTDLEPPDTSPTPTVIGGVGALHVRWEAITNNDPVTYDVYLSTTPDFVKDETTFIGSTESTMLTIRSDANGDPLQGGTEAAPIIYYVSILARDADGPATNGPSPEDSDTLHFINNSDVSSFYTIVADQIIGGTLSSEVTVSGIFKTAGSGRRVVMDTAGLHLYDSTGVRAIVDLPTDASTAAQFNGDANMQALSVGGGLKITDPHDPDIPAAVVDVSAELLLASGLSAPPPPSTSIVYDAAPTINSGIPRDSVATSTIRNYVLDGTDLYFDLEDDDKSPGKPTGTIGVFKVPLDGSAPATQIINRDPPASLSTYPQVQMLGGLAILGLYGYWLYNERISAYKYRWKVRRFLLTDPSASTIYSLGTTDFDYSISTNGPGAWHVNDEVRIASDGTNIWIYRHHTPGVDNSGSDVAVNTTYQYSATMTATGISYVVSGLGSNDYVNSYYCTAADFGGMRHIFLTAVSGVNTPKIYVVSGGALVIDSNSQFDLASGGQRIFWDGTQFRGYPANFPSTVIDNKLPGIYYSSLTWTTSTSPVWWVSQTWRDTSATPKSSTQSTRVSLTMKKRAKLRVTSNAPIPTTLGPNSVMFYVGVGTTDPGRTAMWDQGTLGVGVLTQSIAARASGAPATNPPAASTFTGVLPGKIVSAATRADGFTPRTSIEGGTGASWIDGLLPPGSMTMWPTNSAPAGWMLCQGQTVLRAAYPDLFAVLGTTFNVGTVAADSFMLPDFRGRAPMGYNPSGTTYNEAIGDSDGETDLTLRHARMSHSHNHTGVTTGSGGHTHGIPGAPTGDAAADYFNPGSGSGSVPRKSFYDGHNHTGSTTTTGSGHSHTIPTESANVHPYLTINMIIKV